MSHIADHYTLIEQLNIILKQQAPLKGTKPLRYSNRVADIGKTKNVIGLLFNIIIANCEDNIIMNIGA